MASLGSSLVPAPASTPAAATTATVLLLFVFQEVLRDGTKDGTSNRAQETMSGLLSEKVATKATSNGAEETAITFGHGRGIGIVVGGVGVGRLASELVVWRNGLAWLSLAWLTLLTHLLLVGLILSIGVVAAILLLRALLAAVVSCVALRVARVVGSELVLLLTVLKSTLLGRAE